MKSLKKLVVSLIVLFLLVSITGCSANKTNTSKVYQWKMASIFNDPATGAKGNSLGEAQQKFVDLVKEKTNGQVIIQPFYSSVLGTQPQLFEQVERGELEIFYGQPMSSADPRFGATSIPYLFKDLDTLRKAVADQNGPFFKLVAGYLKDHHTILLAMGPSGLRGFENNKHPVKSVKDLKDLKVRTYEDPVVNLFWSGICITQPLSWSETISALQTKTVDGIEFPISSCLGTVGELLKYYTDINWQFACNANIIVNEDTWNKLPSNLQQAVREAAIEAMQYQGELEAKYTNEALTTLRDRGWGITLLTPEERQEWINYARSLDDKMKKIIGEDTFNAMMEAAQYYNNK
jgi:TRAP-type C4-dicarboxylate transport system substrate-binding protein